MDMKKVEKYMTDPKTHAKASMVLLELHKLKEDDYEAVAICLMLTGTARKVVEGAEQ